MKSNSVMSIAMAVSAGLLLFIICISFGLDYYTSKVLLWDEHQQRMMLFSGGSVIWALLLLMWVRAAERKSKLAENQKEGESEADTAIGATIGGNIIDMVGWTMLCLALTFSEAHKEWHIIREAYYALGLAASLVIVYSYYWKYKRSQDSNEKNASLFGFLYLTLPLVIIWKYISGDQTLF